MSICKKCKRFYILFQQTDGYCMDCYEEIETKRKEEQEQKELLEKPVVKYDEEMLKGINTSSILSTFSCPNCEFEEQIAISKFQHDTTHKCPDCSSEFQYTKNCIFDSHQYADISPNAIMHPLDKNAINALRKIPILDFALRKMMEYGYEKIMRVHAMANDVKVTSQTYSHIYEMAEEASKCLGIAMPDVYINQNPIPNAFTIGSEYPLITIHSGLIELLNEDELYSAIAHEMTHIKCHHVLYHMLANFLLTASNVLGVVGSLITPLNLALLEWSRKA